MMELQACVIRNLRKLSFLSLLFFFFLLGVIWHPVVAQDIEDSDQKSALHIQADQLYKDAKYDSAAVYYEEVAEHYLDKNKQLLYLKTLNRLGQTYRILADYDKAKRVLNAALDYERVHQVKTKEFPTTLNSLASIHLDLDENDQAEQLTLEAITFSKKEFGESVVLADSYQNLGKWHRANGRFDQALTYYLKAKDIFEKKSKPGDVKLESIYNRIAIVSYFKGNLYKSVEMFKEAAESVRLKKGEMHEDVAGYYNNVAIVYRELGDYREAAKYITKSLRIQRSLFGEMHPDLGSTYSSLANLYRDMGEYEQALDYLKKDLAIAIKTQGPNHYDVARSYYSLAQLQRRLGRDEEALKSLDEYFKIAESNFPDGHSDIMKAYMLLNKIYYDHENWVQAEKYSRKAYELGKSLESYEKITLAGASRYLGRSLLKQNKFEDALVAFQKSLQILAPGFTSDDFTVNPKLTRELYIRDVATVLDSKADALAKYYQQNKNNKYRQASLSSFDLSIEIIEKLQQEFRSEESKLFLAARSHKIFENAIEACHLFYKYSNDPIYLDKAYTYAEKGRSRVILEQINDSHAKQFSGVPDSLIRKENKLREVIAELQLDVASASFDDDSLKASTLRDSLYTMDDQLSDHIEMLEQRYPQYHRLKYGQNVITAEEFSKRMLSEDQALIEYFRGEEKLYTFVLRSGEIHLHTQRIDSTFDEQINRFRTSILQHRTEEMVAESYTLYKRLISPIRTHLKGVDQLLIVPDGDLYYLPFGALVTTEASEKARYNDLAYLIRDFNISYTPSATIYWQDRQQSNKPEPPKQLMAVAPMFMDANKKVYAPEPIRSDSITPLPMTRYEVQSIAEEFINNRGMFSWLFNSSEPTILLEEEARESYLKSGELSKYKYLHFATHAYIKEDDPNLSGIQFYDDENTDDDGVLLANEVYNLEINADLVVLSACDTGLGDIVKGEGLIGFTRPFTYAGASNIMVSLWKVADRSTAESMIGFYHRALAGESYSKALRQTKMEMINSRQFADPWYWAPFILIGQ